MLYVAKINSFLCKIQYKVRSWLWLWLLQFSNLLSCSIQHFRPLWAHFIFRLEEVSMSHLPYFSINKLNSINRTLWSLVPVVFLWHNIFKIFMFSNYQWITSWKYRRDIIDITNSGELQNLAMTTFWNISNEHKIILVNTDFGAG